VLKPFKKQVAALWAMTIIWDTDPIPDEFLSNGVIEHLKSIFSEFVNGSRSQSDWELSVTTQFFVNIMRENNINKKLEELLLKDNFLNAKNYSNLANIISLHACKISKTINLDENQLNIAQQLILNELKADGNPDLSGELNKESIRMIEHIKDAI
jgi:hypothetical protein